MLAQILPGFRQLRAPLAAGFLWLLVGWIAVRPFLPDPYPHIGPLADVRDAFGTASVLGQGVAVSFAAFLIGSLSEALTSWFARGWRALAPTNSPSVRLRAALGAPLERLGAKHHEGTFHLTQLVRIRLLDWVERDFQEAPDQLGLPTWIGIVDEQVPKTELLDTQNQRFLDTQSQRIDWRRRALDAIVDGIVDEFDRITIRMQIRLPDLYQVVDRLRAEAEFRWAVSLPLFALGIAMTSANVRETGPAVVDIGGLGLMVAALAIYRLGSDAEARGTAALVDALIAGSDVNAPLLERLRERRSLSDTDEKRQRLQASVFARAAERVTAEINASVSSLRTKTDSGLRPSVSMSGELSRDDAEELITYLRNAPELRPSDSFLQRTGFMESMKVWMPLLSGSPYSQSLSEVDATFNRLIQSTFGEYANPDTLVGADHAAATAINAYAEILGRKHPDLLPLLQGRATVKGRPGPVVAESVLRGPTPQISTDSVM
jgi:hypothetical protein